MLTILKLIPLLLYLIVGATSLLMAFKSIFSREYLPFQQKAAGKNWNQIDHSTQQVILALLRLSGLGFLITGLLLIIFPIATYFIPSGVALWIIPLIAIIYCTGLFIINYSLHKQTNARTPWKGSLYTIGLIVIAMCISLLA